MLQFRRGDLLRMQFVWCGSELSGPDFAHVIGVHMGVSARCVSGATSMLRRLRHGRKADTGNGTTATHTGHDDQSETDSQSQFSEEINTAPQVLSSKRKALVCTDTKTANGH